MSKTKIISTNTNLRYFLSLKLQIFRLRLILVFSSSFKKSTIFNVPETHMEKFPPEGVSLVIMIEVNITITVY